MRSHSSFALRAFFALACACGAASYVGTRALAQNDKKPVKVSDGESKLAQQIEKATDAAAKLTAAEEFIKKYPKSTLRPQIAKHLAGQVVGAPEAQRIALAERYLSLFSEPGENEFVTPALVNSYAAAERFDDAFRVGAAWLAKNQDDAPVLAVLSFHGINQAARGNQKFAQQAREYGPRALKLFEADTRPARFDDALWKETKESWTPKVHQSLGFLAILTEKWAEALPHLEKAAALAPSDPLNYFLLGNLKDNEYRQMAAQYQGLMPGPARNEMLTKINAKLDEIVDLYARAVALAEGQPAHQQLREQVIQDMTSYYKFRHNGSTNGMQQLIDKYKPQPAKP